MRGLITMPMDFNRHAVNFGQSQLLSKRPAPHPSFGKTSAISAKPNLIFMFNEVFIIKDYIIDNKLITK